MAPAFVSAMNLEFAENRVARKACLGIYKLEGAQILFLTQLVVIKELDETAHAYLRVLTRKPRKQDVGRFLELYKNMQGKAEREHAASILEVFLAANRKWADEWKKRDRYCRISWSLSCGRQKGRAEKRK